MKHIPVSGELLEVCFLDHCEGSDDGEAMPFRVFGVVLSVSRQALEIGSWVHDDMKKHGDDNETRYTIVRKAITSIRPLT